MTPRLRNRRDVEIEFALVLEQSESFRVRLHHSVLDAVVNHLDEVSRAGQSAMQMPVIFRRRKYLYVGQDHARRPGIGAVCQRVAVFESPNAARHTTIDEMDSCTRERRRPPLRI